MHHRDSMENAVDLFIIGGGINGAAIAADAAGRGLSVTLCDKGDLGGATSSASSKLIHGGLRYLEQYEFTMVRKALREREILMKRAPHLIQPLQFILPYEKHLRAKWLIRIGLFLYDHLAKRTLLPRSRSLHLKKHILQAQFNTGFSYYDCLTDDSRLVIANAKSASEQGATILNYTEFVGTTREMNYWKIELRDTFSKKISYCYAKVLVNAAGPWINEVQKKINPHKQFPIQLVQGSHIVTKKLYSENHAYILQNQDGRIIFTIPFQRQFTLIGTTDHTLTTHLDNLQVGKDDIDYLCSLINFYFIKKISPQDIIWMFSGVRCLQDHPAENVSTLTREHKLDLTIENTLPILTIIGGKLTTHRILAEEAMQQLNSFFPKMKPAWTAHTFLPGGRLHQNNFIDFYQTLLRNKPWLPEDLAYRYAKSYGSDAYTLLKNIHSISDLGKSFGSDLFEHEVNYLITHEWAKTTEDILWRRTKLGLLISHSVQFFHDS